jgi:type II secretory pathway pseudopilin PulG
MTINVSAAPQPVDRESGTSLIELMFGTVIVITLLLAVSTMIIALSRARRAAEERNLAMVACRNVVEQLRDMPVTQLPALHGTGFDVQGVNGAAGGLHPQAGDPDGLPGRFSVVVDQTSGMETIYLVTLRVDWTGYVGNQRFEVKTLLMERKGS